MRLTVESAQAEYHRLNTVYFDGALPDVDIEIVNDLRMNVGRRSRLWGATSKMAQEFKIQLVAGMPYELWLLKLGHEMVHVEIWPRSHRSKEWRNERARLGRSGFFAEVF